MGTRIVEAMIPIEPPQDGGVATEFRLLQAGLNRYNDGDKILFDEDAASSVMQRYKARGIDLMADYEHQSLVRPPIEAPASAKKWTPEVRGGHLMATNIQWTEKAKGYLASGEYRYFSIACRVDAKTNRCIELINFALTNLPAANGISALVAASRNVNDEDNEMSKTLIVALGLAADADETVALSAIHRLREQHRELVALSGKGAHAEALGEIAAWKASHGEVVAMRARLTEIEINTADAEFNAVLEQASKDAKIPPAADDARRVFAMSLRGKPDGLTMLKSYTASLPTLVAGASGEKRALESEPHGGDSTVVSFSRGELEMAKALTGNRPDKMLQDIASWRAAGNTVKYGGFTETEDDKTEARRIIVARKG
jgi:phage I-like protein